MLKYEGSTKALEASRLIEESRYLAFSGLRVHFRLAKPEDAVKNRMLFLSSPLINTFHWRKLLPELTELQCLCVLADLPGFGLSDAEAPQAQSVKSNMLWGILDHVDRDTDAPMSMWHLMGHGSACSTILRMAAMYPDSVKSQIHVCPTFTLPPAENRGDPGRWYDVHIANPQRFHRLIEHYAGYPMDDYIVDRMRRPLTRPGMRRTFEKLLKSAAQPPSQGMGFCPTMALVGRMDPLLDDVRQEQMAALLPDAETHNIRSAGHFPMETHSKAMRDYLRGWLRYND